MAELSRNSIIYTPDCKIEGVVQIIHDMADHQGRYREMAHYFTDHGYITVTSDIRGHGNNVSRASELGFFGDNAVSRITGDIHENSLYIRETFPDLTYALIGQGMGALIATIYFKKYDNFIDALFLSGMPSCRPLRYAGSLLMMVLIALNGEYNRSRFVNHIIMSRYCSRYTKEGSEHAWLSLDQNNVIKYDNDPKCGFIYTLNGYRTLIELMNQTYGGISWIKKNKNCPVRLLYGADDTCMPDKSALYKTTSLFSDNGYINVECAVYQDRRHELFRDYDCGKVFSDIIREIEIASQLKVLEKANRSHRPEYTRDYIDPLEEDIPSQEPEKIDLENFVNSHSVKDSNTSKVEMIDFSITDNIEGSSSDNAKLMDGMFITDPDNMDGMN